MLRLALPALLLPSLLLAQSGRRPIGPCDTLQQPSVVLYGRVTIDSVPGWAVITVRHQSCVAMTESARDGWYEIRGLPPGRISIEGRGLGREPRDTSVVLASDSQRVDLALVQHDPFASCRREVDCAVLLRLDRGPPFPLPTTTDSLIELGLRLAVAFTTRPHDSTTAVTACVSVGSGREYHSPPADVLRALSVLSRPVVSVAHCRVEGRGLESHWRAEHASGPALRLFADVASVGPDQADLLAGYSAASLDAIGWRCAATRTEGVWHVVRCRLEWIS